MVEAVGLPASRTEQVDHDQAPRRQELGDQPAVTLLPGRLSAQDARPPPVELPGEGLLELRCGHTRGVAPESLDPDAAESLLARLPASPAAELDGVAVVDAGVPKRLSERGLVELWIAPRRREAANVDERLDSGFAQGRHQLERRAHTMSERKDVNLMHRIAALMVGRGGRWLGW